MSLMRKLFYFFIFLLLCSCSAKTIKESLSKAECLMEDCPGSALVLLNEEYTHANELSTDDKMKLMLLRAAAMNKSYLRMDTLDYMSDLLEYYKSHEARRYYAMACYLQGCVYRYRGDSKLALKYYQDAASSYMVCEDGDKFHQIAVVYGQMGFVFDNARIPLKALEAWRNCQKYALISGDTILSLQGREYTGYMYASLSNLDSAVAIAKNVYYAYRLHGRTDYAAIESGALANYYLQMDSLAEAKQYIDEYVAHSGMFDSNGNLKKGHELFYYCLGDYYERSGNADSALFYYRRVLGDATRLNSRENGCRGLMRVYAKLGEADSVAKYANMFADANDSASYRQSEADINRLQAVYDYSESQKRAAAEAERAGRYRFLAALLVAALLVVAFSLYIYIIRYRRRKALALQRINADYTDALSRYDAAVKDREMLRLGLEECRRKKDEEIGMLRERLASFCADDEEGEALPAVQSLDSHPTIIHAHRRIAKGEILSVGEVNCIVALVRDALPGFYEALGNSGGDLSEKEKILCVLTRLRFLPSEIATALGITVQGVSNMRSRLNSRMFHKKGTRSFTANIYRM